MMKTRQRETCCNTRTGVSKPSVAQTISLDPYPGEFHSTEKSKDLTIALFNLTESHGFLVGLFVLFFVFVGPHLWHKEVPRLGV